MIKLRFTCFESIIEFDERYINIIEIGEKDLFKKVLYLINKYSNSYEEGNDIILLHNDNRLDISRNILVVSDFYNVDTNSNNILKSLYRDIETQYNCEFGDQNLNLNLQNVLNNIEEILCYYDFQFQYKRELKVSEILKTIGLKFNKYYYDNPFDNIVFLFDLISNFNLYKVIVLINLKLFFTEEEVVEIYKCALHREIKLLVFEFGEETKLLKYENKLYIDNDFDEFQFK